MPGCSSRMQALNLRTSWAVEPEEMEAVSTPVSRNVAANQPHPKSFSLPLRKEKTQEFGGMGVGVLKGKGREAG